MGQVELATAKIRIEIIEFRYEYACYKSVGYEDFGKQVYIAGPIHWFQSLGDVSILTEDPSGGD